MNEYIAAEKETDDLIDEWCARTTSGLIDEWHAMLPNELQNEESFVISAGSEWNDSAITIDCVGYAFKPTPFPQDRDIK